MGRKPLELIGLEIRRPPRRMDTRNKQNFGAQVISETGDERLVDEQRSRCAPRETPAFESLPHFIRVQARVHYIGTESLKERMLGELLVCKNVDIRRAVQQCAMRRRMEFDAQLPVCLRHTRSLHRVPATVQLVVTV